MQHIELTDAQIANIREKLRTSGDRHLLPLGHNLTDEQIEKLAYIAQETDNENRPTSDEFECDSCGECIFESEAEECEECGRGCCSLCSPENICADCRG